MKITKFVKFVGSLSASCFSTVSPIQWLILAINGSVFWGSFYFFRGDSLLLGFAKAYGITAVTTLLTVPLSIRETRKFYADEKKVDLFMNRMTEALAHLS